MNSAMLQNQLTQLKQDNAELGQEDVGREEQSTISQFGDLAQRLTDLERRASNRQEELEEVILAKESNRKEEEARGAARGGNGGEEQADQVFGGSWTSSWRRSRAWA